MLPPYVASTWSRICLCIVASWDTHWISAVELGAYAPSFFFKFTSPALLRFTTDQSHSDCLTLPVDRSRPSAEGLVNVLRKKNKFHWANEVRLAVRKKKEFYAERVTCLLALFLHTHTQAYRVYEEEDKGKKKSVATSCHTFSWKRISPVFIGFSSFLSHCVFFIYVFIFYLCPHPNNRLSSEQQRLRVCCRVRLHVRTKIGAGSGASL